MNVSNDTEGEGRNGIARSTNILVDFLKTHTGEPIETIEVSDILGISRRRLYDIVNTLDGVGVVKKEEKGMIRWVGSDPMSPFSEERLIEKEKQLEALLAAVSAETEKLFTSREFHEYAYLPTAQLYELVQNDPDYIYYTITGTPSLSVSLKKDDGQSSLVIKDVSKVGFEKL